MKTKQDPAGFPYSTGKTFTEKEIERFKKDHEILEYSKPIDKWMATGKMMANESMIDWLKEHDQRLIEDMADWSRKEVESQQKRKNYNENKAWLVGYADGVINRMLAEYKS